MYRVIFEYSAIESMIELLVPVRRIIEAAVIGILRAKPQQVRQVRTGNEQALVAAIHLQLSDHMTHGKVILARHSVVAAGHEQQRFEAFITDKQPEHVGAQIATSVKADHAHRPMARSGRSAAIDDFSEPCVDDVVHLFWLLAIQR